MTEVWIMETFQASKKDHLGASNNRALRTPSEKRRIICQNQRLSPGSVCAPTLPIYDLTIRRIYLPQ